ncbi:uncharacterized protein LOC121861690 [Homarus americanus]|uniref:uncharacterized protein LOC121861690 n=1 Tax=Homarus americanus TaxID=6706 RepID=UPI001C442068|nr:uncharacterized protein LOC121861690 [Homarus americanus]
MAEAGPADDDFEDFDDDSNFWDDCDEYYEPETLNDERQREQQLTQEDWEQQLPQHHRRRERVAELVETERNYIKDLETLLEVSALASSRNHVLKAIDLHTVLGNISQYIIEKAKAPVYIFFFTCLIGQSEQTVWLTVSKVVRNIKRNMITAKTGKIKDKEED